MSEIENSSPLPGSSPGVAESVPTLTGEPQPRTARGRRASVRLSDQPTFDAEGNVIDPGTRSLGDALKITYRLLQFFMLAVLGLYLLSGFQTIGASERGVRLTFGKVTGSDLPPGFTPSWPEPVGELIKIGVSNEPLRLNKEFFVNLSEAELANVAREGTASLAGGGMDALDPDADGMLLLGDGSIAHARVEVNYRRVRPVEYVTNIHPEFEKNIVRSAVRRGMVRAAAQVNLDEFINNTLDSELHAGDGRPFNDVAKAYAQEALAGMDSGVQLVEFNVLDRIPPRRVMTEFNRVQSATQEARRRIREAEEYRQKELIAVAGEAAGPILSAIDAYEARLAEGEEAEAAAALARVDALMLGEEEGPLVTGDVTGILNEARQYRTTVASEARTRLAVFRAKKSAFEANPRVMIAGEWTEAFGAFLARPTTQTMILPPGTDRTVVSINQDPMIKQERVREMLEKEAAENQLQQQRRLERERFQKRFDAETVNPSAS